MDFSFGISTKGKRTLTIGSNEYVRNRETKAGICHWKCRYNVAFKCRSVVHTKNDEVVKQPTDHTHTARPYSPIARKVLGEMKKQMAEPGATAKLISSHGISGTSVGVKIALPKKTSLARTLQRAKKTTTVSVIAVPKDRKFPIPEKYVDIILHDTGVQDNDRIILLGKQPLLVLLESDDLWIADGTFKIVPEIFYQAYSIHVQKKGIAFLCVMALLPAKTEVIYTKFLNILKGLLYNLSPGQCLVDFEMAAINAFSKAFPGVIVKCCFFHLKQSVLRKISELGLKVPYENNEQDFAIHVNMVCALSCLPEEEVVDSFLEVADLFPDVGPGVESFITYFETTYVRGRELRNGRRRDPLFCINRWNHYGDILDGIARSSNSAEGFHFSVQSLFQCAHPTMWKFLDGMKLELELQHKNYLDYVTGNRIPQKKKYRLLKDRIQNIVQNYDKEKKIDYLRALAHTV